MSTLNVTIHHGLGRDEALNRIKSLVTQMEAEFAHEISDVHEEWENDIGTFGFTARGFDISGKITVGSSEVVITCSMPFTVFLFKGDKIKSVIQERATALLSSNH